ncbi:YicC/YloC family endoribonuclease [Schleiferia thermophila]|jgi:uncharacterized protein (TIGR00255 family)|uniref:Uncharacterized protein (TIGR00255 family) n=1 Tax=Schleiferia thermophila TaxID=884107 RepID=A0A368ZYJ2_9FLAO|nr:YicC/YloC family endoribonuclease [Schleiferia thermophila]KFD38757.1 hypothetical protein AT05_08935 [Schleiferia thermophila str. Yellowstone]PMB29493.1 YicC family protein [Fischerella thermalis CCMEE 5319]RCX02031.1 uncharacterized protein (TIGR00255 family) [Schleiferia thermophila]
MPVFSMTGFGKHSFQVKNKNYTIEIKTLNSKQLDLTLRIPPEFRPLEPTIRKIMSSALERGKVDVAIYAENCFDYLPFDEKTLLKYVSYFKKLSESQSIHSDPLLAALRMPDLFSSPISEDFSTDEIFLIESEIFQCVSSVITHRKEEGQSLKTEFQRALGEIKKLLSQIEPYEQSRIAHVRSKLMSNLKSLGDECSFDTNRFEQELIYYLEKMDFTEEKVRLASHLNYFETTMENEASCGRKLNFIAQEMGREINTLGAKANHAEIQKIVVQMKDELEKIKEQVLNVL